MELQLELPIEILSFKEILNILITKYSFFKKSKIVINDYECAIKNGATFIRVGSKIFSEV